MKLHDRLLGMIVVAGFGFAGCAVCDTCDDFPAPCSGPNCGQNGLPAYMNGGPAVMGSMTPAVPPTDDSAGPGPTMPAAEPMSPATPAVNPAPASSGME